MTKARTRRGYSDETAARVKSAFDEIDARGEVVMPGEIARMVRLSPATVTHVLHDAPYWTLERFTATRRVSADLSNAAQEVRRKEQGFTGHGYTLETAENVRTAFNALVARSDVVMQPEIARMTGLSLTTVNQVLRDAPYWTPQCTRAALKEAGKRGYAANEANGHQNLKDGLATNKSAGFPSLVRAREIQAAAGYPNLKKAVAIVARSQRGRPSKGTTRTRRHYRTRYRIYVSLATWDDNVDGSRFHRVLARKIGCSAAWVGLILQRLRADGLIDADNRVIAPWPDTDPTTTSDPVNDESREGA